MELCRVQPGGGAPTRRAKGFTRLIYAGSLQTGRLAGKTKLLGRRVQRLSSLVVGTTSRGDIPTNKTLTISHSTFSNRVAGALRRGRGVAIVRRRLGRLPRKLAIVTANPLASSSLTTSVGRFVNSRKLCFCSTTTPVIRGTSLSVSGICLGSHCSHKSTTCLGYPVARRRFRGFCGRLVGTRATRLRTFRGREFFRKYVPVRRVTSHNGGAVLFNPLGPIKLRSPEANGRPCTMIRLHRSGTINSLCGVINFRARLG